MSRAAVKARAGGPAAGPGGAGAWSAWQRVRAAKPLVHCITNYVSMEVMAGTLLAAGASPAMVHSADEVEAFARISSALLINMGTLSSEWVAAKKLAARSAVGAGVPWVLDPVGCGATPFRTRACLDLLACRPTVVRGNASEIMALAGAEGSVRGVDSTAASIEALRHAAILARVHGCTVAVSGEVDYITDGSKVLEVRNGEEMLTLVTAAGCSLTALVAAFVSQHKDDPVAATAFAMDVSKLGQHNTARTMADPAPAEPPLFSGTELLLAALTYSSSPPSCARCTTTYGLGYKKLWGAAVWEKEDLVRVAAVSKELHAVATTADHLWEPLLERYKQQHPFNFEHKPLVVAPSTTLDVSQAPPC
ncbi:hypothetical protein FOA52_013430 [Chlamydomonas sp. UWO 241]|nr:hypothetical protein FOA52_013430 [Chlamydomonas sp. UWO 241]